MLVATGRRDGDYPGDQRGLGSPSPRVGVRRVGSAIKLYVAFWLACVREAARGTLQKANVIAWFLGWLLLWLWFWWRGLDTRVAEDIPSLLTQGAAALCVAWIVIFVFRLLGAPARLHAKAQEQVAELEQKLSPRFTLSFDNEGFHHVPHEHEPRKKQNGQRTACAAWWVLVRVRNESASWLHGCVAHLAAVSFKDKEDERYEAVPHPHSMKLAFMAPDGFDPVEFAPGLSRFVCVFAIDEIDERIRIIWPNDLQAFDSLFCKSRFLQIDRSGINRRCGVRATQFGVRLARSFREAAREGTVISLASG
jgi:hypothetical protein